MVRTGRYVGTARKQLTYTETEQPCFLLDCKQHLSLNAKYVRR